MKRTLELGLAAVSTSPSRPRVCVAVRLLPPWNLLGVAAKRGARSSGSQWFQISKTRQKIWLLDVISQVFPCKLLQIYITSVSGYLCFIFKTYQIVAGISMIRQFHEFFKSYFWRGFAIWFSCVACLSHCM